MQDDVFDGKGVGERPLAPWPLLCSLQGGSLPCAALLCFSTEGDNIPEAMSVAAAAARALQLPLESRAPPGQEGTAQANGAGKHHAEPFVPPASWRTVFGGPARAVIY